MFRILIKLKLLYLLFLYNNPIFSLIFLEQGYYLWQMYDHCQEKNGEQSGFQ